MLKDKSTVLNDLQAAESAAQILENNQGSITQYLFSKFQF
jgi:hypothetical protein